MKNFLFFVLLILQVSLHGMGDATRSPRNLEELLPKDLWVAVAALLPGDSVFLNELSRRFILAPQSYQKIAHAFAQSLDFYPKVGEIDTLLATNFSLVKNNTISRAAFQEHMRQALLSYIACHNYGYLKDLLDADTQKNLAIGNRIIAHDYQQLALTQELYKNYITPYASILDDGAQPTQVITTLTKHELKHLHATMHEYTFLVKRCLKLLRNAQTIYSHKANATKLTSIQFIIGGGLLLFTLAYMFKYLGNNNPPYLRLYSIATSGSMACFLGTNVTGYYSIIKEKQLKRDYSSSVVLVSFLYMLLKRLTNVNQIIAIELTNR